VDLYVIARAVLALLTSTQAEAHNDWHAALTLMEVAEPYPELLIVEPRHPMLRGGAISAQAARYDSGREALFISEAAVHRRDILEHEAAHFAAWREHGEAINPHGPEWKRWCKARATKPKACKPTDFGRIN
jgi:hypothetical protein